VTPFLLGAPVYLALTIYTVNLGRWLWGRGYRAGAVTAWTLAALNVAVSLWVAVRPP